VRAPDLGKITVVSNKVTIPNHSQDTVGANCSDGQRLISGGAASSIYGMPIAGSRPSDNPDQWIAHARNDSGIPVDLTVYALCLRG
jgi:hypothetical protein